MELSSPWHLPTFPFLLKISQGTFIFFLYVHKNEVSLEFPFAHLLSLLLVIFYPTCSLVSSHLIQWSRNTTIRRSLYTITTSQHITLPSDKGCEKRKREASTCCTQPACNAQKTSLLCVCRKSTNFASHLKGSGQQWAKCSQVSLCTPHLMTKPRQLWLNCGSRELC